MRVFESGNQNLLGHLIDINADGFMLITEQANDTNVTFNLSMALPEKSDNEDIAEFKATSLWCKKGINHDYFDVGFKINEISDIHSQVMASMVKEPLFRD